MVISLARHKGDPTGEKKMKRHVHCNPLEPWGCFIFWLGVRLLCSYSCGKSHFVFADEVLPDEQSGSSAFTTLKERAFGTWMHKVMKGLSMEGQYTKFGVAIEDLGTQSNRKGGLEEMTTSPDGPPPIAALLWPQHR